MFHPVDIKNRNSLRRQSWLWNSCGFVEKNIDKSHTVCDDTNEKTAYMVCASRAIVESMEDVYFENVEQNVMFSVVGKINFGRISPTKKSHSDVRHIRWEKKLRVLITQLQVALLRRFINCMKH